MVLHCYKARELHLFVISNRGDWDQTWTSINHFMLGYVVDSTSLPSTALVSIFSAREPIAQLGERRTLRRKVVGSILTWGAVLCP